MKKFYFASLASLFLLSACSKDENTPAESIPDGIVFELSAVNELNTSRAPLYSQEAVHSVENVSVYVFQQSGLDYLYLKTFTITGWTKGSNFMRYEVPAGETLPAGTYKFLGVGTDNGSPYTLTTPTPATKFDDFSAWIATASNQELEIFSGSTTAPVVGTGARIPILMTRQVAGVLGYFKNVPAEIGGVQVKFLRLTVSNANKQVNLTTSAGSNPINVNYMIINSDLSGQTVNSDGAYSGNNLTAQGIQKLPNTQLNGAFLLPVNLITMTLGLYDQNGLPLKTWVVMDTALSTFNILPNHFYTLGVKTQNGNTNGGGGVGAIPDAPIDLMKDQVISVTISPAWTLRHDLVIL